MGQGLRKECQVPIFHDFFFYSVFLFSLHLLLIQNPKLNFCSQKEFIL